MRFVFTMNMPSHNGNPVHQIIAEHASESVADLINTIAGVEFLLVEEYYLKRDHRTDRQYLERRGEIALNPLFIGKIKEMEGDLRE